MTMNSPLANPNLTQREVLSISLLNESARALLEGNFPLVWVEGEISNLARPASGHLYLSLKDASAQVRCAMFRMRSMHLGFKPENGMQVLVRAKLSLYVPRGDYQLIIEHMEEAGDGALRRAYEQLKQRLHQEGLFAEEDKQALPTMPRAIGVVTSPSGAAIHDITSTLQRRFPALPVILYPVAVQGEGAGKEIARAITLAGKRDECDVLIVGRGGGSLEDLWAFNEEPVARAIYNSEIPVVSAVGHEVDFTIADFVADVRAPTPTAAAELVSPSRDELLAQLEEMKRRLLSGVTTYTEYYRQTLSGLNKRLKHPGRRLQDIAQRVDELESRLANARRVEFRHNGTRLAELYARLQRHTPQHRLESLQARQDNLQKRLKHAMQHQLTDHKHQLASAVRALDTISPLATLGRGYAIVSHHDKDDIIRNSKELSSGDRIKTRLARGQLICQVEEIHEE